MRIVMNGVVVTRRAACAMVLAGVVLSLAGASQALAARGYEYKTSFGSGGSGTDQFDKPEGVAVNESTGRVYVADRGNDRVEYFSSGGSYEGSFEAPPGGFEGPQSIAVDNSTSGTDPSKGDVYVANQVPYGSLEKPAVYKFSEIGKYLGYRIVETPEYEKEGKKYEAIPFNTSVTEFLSVAVDSQGDLWISYSSTPDTRGTNNLTEFNDEVDNEFLETSRGASSFNGPGLAVDAYGHLYVAYKYQSVIPAVSAVKKIAGPVSGPSNVLDPEVGGEAAGWPGVESSTNDVYVSQGDRVGRYSLEGAFVERLGEGHLQTAAGIAVDSAKGQIYVADEAGDDVEVYEPEPVNDPKVTAESVSEVTSSSARFSGEVDPRSEAADKPTDVFFEYGACASVTSCVPGAYETTVAATPEVLAPTFEVPAVGVHLQDLSPHTVYHFRVRAVNGLGTAFGEEQVFTTQATGGQLVLPDGRAWELVSPANMHGAVPYPITEAGLAQAAASGDAFTFVTSTPTEADPQGFDAEMQVLAMRGAQGGWSSRDIETSHTAAIGVYAGIGDEYRFFSEDLSQAVVEPFGPFSPPVSEGRSETSPRPSERTPYLRHDLTCEAQPGTCYEPLATSVEGEGDVTSGEKFGGVEFGLGANVFGKVGFVAATPDLAHVIVSSEVRLTGASAPDGGLYEWTAAAPATERLQLISTLPEGATQGSFLPGRFGDAARAVSADGSRVVFTAQAAGQAFPHLYMHIAGGGGEGETIRLDVAEGGSASGQGEGVYQTASVDGSRVFFTTSARLKSGAGSVGADLYECQIVHENEKWKCALSDLTPVPGSGSPGAGESAQVQGVLGASENGSYVYFVAKGVQASGATAGADNLYMEHEGVTSFIAKLSEDDKPDWAGLNGLSSQPVDASGDGLWLAFMSDRSLTGYDNLDAKSGKPDEEVYLYDAQTQRLVCASCNPTGARPEGAEYKKIVGAGGIAGGFKVWPETQWIAANVPGWTPYRVSESLHQSRYLTDQGRLFFNSHEALVPQDENGNEDVYEYEPPAGPGGPENDSCTTASEAYSPLSEGCVSLISSGRGAGESAFLDASESGDDVFFLSQEDMAGGKGTGLKVYDAHVCTAASPCAPAPAVATPPCESASACRTALEPQPGVFGPPASATFTGLGNPGPSSATTTTTKPTAVRKLTRAQKLTKALQACGKEPKRRRAACEKTARGKYGAVAKAKKGHKK